MDEHFNPRTHKECDTRHTANTVLSLYFNPRTHKECDITHFFDVDEMEISIHALTRSATGSKIKL